MDKITQRMVEQTRAVIEPYAGERTERLMGSAETFFSESAPEDLPSFRNWRATTYLRYCTEPAGSLDIDDAFTSGVVQAIENGVEPEIGSQAAAVVTGFARQTILRWCQSGLIKARKRSNGRWVINTADALRECSKHSPRNRPL